MAPGLYYIVVSFFFLYFCNFPNYNFFQTIRNVLLPCSVQRLFSVDELIVLLKENTVRNPEFDYDRSELADMDDSECKEKFIKHDLPELVKALHLSERFCYSQRQKEENHKDAHGSGISKINEKLI